MEWWSALIVHEPRGRRKGGGRGGAAGDAHEVHELRELRVGLRVVREPLVVLHVDVPADWQPRRVGGSGCRSLVVMRWPGAARSCVAGPSSSPRPRAVAARPSNGVYCFDNEQISECFVLAVVVIILQPNLNAR